MTNTATPFKDGDRIAFIGDSITHGGQYHLCVFAYYVTRFPDVKITYFNNGLNGDVAKGAIRRFDSDIMITQPNRAVIMLGMNDIRRSEYKSENPDEMTRIRLQGFIETYKQDMETLTDLLLEKNIPAILIGPSIYDNTLDSPGGHSFGANEALAKCSALLKTMAAEKGLGYVDFNAPMLMANRVVQRDNPRATIVSSDRVHPGPVGTLMMAYLLLKGQGVPAEVAVVEVDVAEPNRTKATNCTLSAMETATDRVSYDYLPAALPFPAVGHYQETDRVIPFTDELNREMITVHGLKDGVYKLEMDGIEVGRFTAGELSEGINIAIAPRNPGQRQSQTVMKSIMARVAIEQNVRRMRECERYLPEGLNIADFEAVKAHMEAHIEKHKPDDHLAKLFKGYLEVHKPNATEYFQQMDTLHRQAYADSRPQVRKVSISHVAPRETVSGTE